MSYFRASILVGFFLFASWYGGASASVMTTYTPGAKISLTGATSEVRFDVADPLYGSSFSASYLDTTTQSLSGAFYIQNIGWALMSSGSYQVRLDCGVQPLSHLTTQCQFTGSGWAENIGEIGFANVRYDPSLGTLLGSIASFAGNFSVEGIALPLLPVTTNESLDSLAANHQTSFSIRNAPNYGDGSWSFQIVPSKNTAYTKTFSSTNGSFSVDLSLADSYSFVITDPQGSKTEFAGVVVGPGSISQVLNATTSIFIQDFCNTHASSCPDGSTRTATQLDKNGSSKVADGSDAYTFTLKLRDQYGNWVNTGSVGVVYTGGLRAVQFTGDAMSYAFLDLGMMPITINGVPWNTTYSSSNLGAVTDIQYALTSLAPTNTNTQKIAVESIKYTAPNGAIRTLSPSLSDIVFDPPYTVTLTPPNPVVISATNQFAGTTTSSATTSLHPELIHLFSVGNIGLARFEDIASDPVTGSYQSTNLDWMVGSDSPSSLTIASLPSSYTLSGVYNPNTPYPDPEDIHYYAFIHYNIGGIDIIYPVVSGTKSSEFQVSRVKILGQNNARSEYGTIATSRRVRTDFFNTLHKNISLLSRNRTSYNDVDYDIRTSDTDVGNNDFSSKRTIIVVGKNITIKNNIDKKDAPLSIIALADKDGQGGDIRIDPSVTEVNAGLFAEHSVFSSGDKQLVIYGTIVSVNTLGSTAIGICPYYVNPCDPAIYDLENLRTYDGSDDSKQSPHSNGEKYPKSSLVIEYDMRLQTDPPPGLLP